MHLAACFQLHRHGTLAVSPPAQSLDQKYALVQAALKYIQAIALIVERCGLPSGLSADNLLPSRHTERQ
jgi:hypothetical protein